MLADSAPVAVLSPEAGGEALAGFRGSIVLLSAGSATASPATVPTPGDVAIVVYESDAGGKPAAVEIGYGSLAASVAGVAGLSGFGRGDILLSGASPASGYGLAECWLALATGAAVVLDGEAFEDAARLQEAIQASGATALHCPAWAWQRLCEAGWKGGPNFKALCLGAAAGDLAAELPARAGLALTLMGSAHVGLWAGGGRLGPGTPAGAWGGPFPGGRWRVVDRALQSVARGLPGELVVEGATVVAGQSGRSGERVRMLPDGQVVHLGPIGARFSLRGRSIEPAEVERALMLHPAVSAAAVGSRPDGLGEPRLVAWVVRKPGQNATDSELRAHLRDLLAGELVPRRIVEMEEMPQGPNGVARSELPSPFLEAAARRHVAPRNEPERILATVWQEALSVPRVGVHDNFFDLGGHSLLCLQVVAQIEKRTGRKLSPRTLLLNTLEQVAIHLAGSGDTEGTAAAPR